MGEYIFIKPIYICFLFTAIHIDADIYSWDLFDNVFGQFGPEQNQFLKQEMCIFANCPLFVFSLQLFV